MERKESGYRKYMLLTCEYISIYWEYHRRKERQIKMFSVKRRRKGSWWIPFSLSLSLYLSFYYWFWCVCVCVRVSVCLRASKNSIILVIRLYIYICDLFICHNVLRCALSNFLEITALSKLFLCMLVYVNEMFNSSRDSLFKVGSQHTIYVNVKHFISRYINFLIRFFVPIWIHALNNF